MAGRPRDGEGASAATIGDARARVGSVLHLRVTLVGSAARRALAGRFAWRVLAVFRRSFYCRGARGALILVGPETLGAGPLHVLWAGSGEAGAELPGLEIGTRVGVDGASADAAAPLVLGLRGAREWRPPAPPPWERSRLRRSLTWLEDAATGAPAEGMGRLIVPLATGAALPEPGPGGSSLARRAWPGVVGLSAWARDALAQGQRAEAPPPAVDGLVGLGPGLTPSGDDVLAGALLALHGLSRGDLAGVLARWLRPRLEGRTGPVSLAHLQCAARGEGAAVLHDALAALSSGDPRSLAVALSTVDTLGHTSGWDGLTGMVAVVAAWRAAADARRREPPCP
jgi:hypothetical protein